MLTDPVPISALQHYLFCPRQCALIHLEGQWAENRLTVEGRHIHDRAHDGGIERRPGVRIARGLALRSDRLGVRGVADVVEFHQPRGPGPPVPFPVEYKRGRPKRHHADRVQLCAQALCLEEMLGVPVPAGALYYHTRRRRDEVGFDETLRTLTKDTARAVTLLLRAGVTPRVRREKKCERCSLLHLCLPDATGGRAGRASAYLARMLTDSRDDPYPDHPS